MKRDWDLIREILIRFESGDASQRVLQLSDFDPARAQVISYNMALMIEAGLVNGEMSRMRGPHPDMFIAERLTWEGHELLDAIRNDTVWGRTKTQFKESGISMTFSLVKDVAVGVGKALLQSGISG